jgi:hypothetical protein
MEDTMVLYSSVLQRAKDNFFVELATTISPELQFVVDELERIYEASQFLVGLVGLQLQNAPSSMSLEIFPEVERRHAGNPLLPKLTIHSATDCLRWLQIHSHKPQVMQEVLFKAIIILAEYFLLPNDNRQRDMNAFLFYIETQTPDYWLEFWNKMFRVAWVELWIDFVTGEKTGL